MDIFNLKYNEMVARRKEKLVHVHEKERESEEKTPKYYIKHIQTIIKKINNLTFKRKKYIKMFQIKMFPYDTKCRMYRVRIDVFMHYFKKCIQENDMPFRIVFSRTYPIQARANHHNVDNIKGTIFDVFKNEKCIYKLVVHPYITEKTIPFLKITIINIDKFQTCFAYHISQNLRDLQRKSCEIKFFPEPRWISEAISDIIPQYISDKLRVDRIGTLFSITERKSYLFSSLDLDKQIINYSEFI